jgi:hypothetical protein
MKEQKSKYLRIKENQLLKDNYVLKNIAQDTIIGFIRKRRVGRFKHWVLEPETYTLFTNGCLKEITKFITNLYGRNRKIQKTT